MPAIVTTISFVTYSLVEDKPLTPAVAFPALAAFNIINIPLLVLPFVANAVVDVLTVNKRLTAFLNAPEVEVTALDTDAAQAAQAATATTATTATAHAATATATAQASTALAPDALATDALLFDGHFVSPTPAPAGCAAIEVGGRL